MAVKGKLSTAGNNSNDHQKQSSQFGLGLLLGFFAGLSSYFLFKSQEGEQLREKFQERWQEAASEIPSITQIKIGDLEIADLVGVLLGTKVSRSMGGEGLKIKDSSRRVSREKTTSPQKFKGV